MTIIGITAEWILGTFPISWSADGNGNMSLFTDSYSDSHWIELALDSMGVYYESYYLGDDDIETDEVWFEFELEAIKDECPNLYKEWLYMDLRNSSYNRKN